MTRPLNVAILGTGSAADMLHGPALRASTSSRLWSVWSRTQERAEHFALLHGAAAEARAFSDFAALLADPELDAVIVTTPDETHEALVIAAADAKKHVLCEKPLATSVVAASRMLEACARNRVHLAVGYHHRFHGGHRKVAALLQQQPLGTLRHMRASWSYRAQSASGWRPQRTLTPWWALSGVGTHCVDMVRWWMEPTCGEIVNVRSMMSSPRFQGPNEETALLLFRFESGATAEVTCSVLFEGARKLELHGDLGAIEARNTLGPYGEGTIHLGNEELRWEAVNPYQAQLEDFEGAIREGRPPLVTGEEGLKNVEILVHAALAEKRR